MDNERGEIFWLTKGSKNIQIVYDQVTPSTYEKILKAFRIRHFTLRLALEVTRIHDRENFNINERNASRNSSGGVEVLKGWQTDAISRDERLKKKLTEIMIFMQITNINREVLVITLKLIFSTHFIVEQISLQHQERKCDKTLWDLCLLLAVSCKGAAVIVVQSLGGEKSEKLLRTTHNERH